MPKAVYTPFNEDEELKDADTAINELVEKVTLTVVFTSINVRFVNTITTNN